MPAPDLDLAAERLDRRFGLAALWLFGSRASGAAREDSDLDLAALFRRSPSPLELLEAQAELGAELGVELDLIDLARASYRLRPDPFQGEDRAVDRLGVGEVDRRVERPEVVAVAV
jgi:predicted nucleotidyltransferase